MEKNIRRLRHTKVSILLENNINYVKVQDRISNDILVERYCCQIHADQMAAILVVVGLTTMSVSDVLA